jgi:hypothetical protein
MQIESRIQGIPCLIEVTTLTVVKPWRGSAQSCPSSDDYYGYSEVEFEVLDRKGYKAAWLERKMTDNDRARIKTEILEADGDEE